MKTTDVPAAGIIITAEQQLRGVAEFTLKLSTPNGTRSQFSHRETYEASKYDIAYWAKNLSEMTLKYLNGELTDHVSDGLPF